MSRYDLSKEYIGFISNFYEGGSTGYQVEVLIRGKEVVFDATREAYDMKDTTEFFPYPCLGEVLFILQVDDAGILTGYVNVNDIKAEDNPVQTGLVMGTYAMFQKQMTEDTPAFGEILKIEDDTVTLTRFDEYRPSGPDIRVVIEDTICHCTYGGSMPRPKDGMNFKLAKDVVIYCWDWSTALIPFCKCTREEAASNKFVTRFSVGTIEDIYRAYWVGFYSTKGNENECDIVKAFPNKIPGFTY